MSSSNSELVRLIDELKQDLSFELLETYSKGHADEIRTTIRRLEEIRSVAERARGVEPSVHCNGTLCPPKTGKPFYCSGECKTNSGGEKGRSE